MSQYLVEQIAARVNIRVGPEGVRAHQYLRERT